MTARKLTIYYDGACHLCSREIEHYQQKDRRGRLKLVDITDPHFSAASEDIDPKQLHRVMHVRLPNGELRTGVKAFLEIWDTLPGYTWLARLVGNRLLYPFFLAGYHSFARIRPFLPKRQRDACEDGSCDIHRGT